MQQRPIVVCVAAAEKAALPSATTAATAAAAGPCCCLLLLLCCCCFHRLCRASAIWLPLLAPPLPAACCCFCRCPSAFTAAAIAVLLSLSMLYVSHLALPSALLRFGSFFAAAVFLLRWLLRSFCFSAGCFRWAGCLLFFQALRCRWWMGSLSGRPVRQGQGQEQGWTSPFRRRCLELRFSYRLAPTTL